MDRTYACHGDGSLWRNRMNQCFLRFTINVNHQLVTSTDYIVLGSGDIGIHGNAAELIMPKHTFSCCFALNILSGLYIALSISMFFCSVHVDFPCCATTGCCQFLGNRTISIALHAVGRH